MTMSQDIRESIQIQQFVNKFLLNKIVKIMNILKDNKSSFILTKNSKN